MIRVHLHAPRENTDPVALGREAAEMLLERWRGSRCLRQPTNAAGGAA